MPRRYWSGLLTGIVALIMILAPAAVPAAQWGMYQHDPQHTGKGTVAGPSVPVLKWQFQHPPQAYDPTFTAGTAVGDDGTIYAAGRDGRAYAINPDGTVKYTFENIGVCCVAPAIGPDGTIYFSGTQLFALNPDFTLKWTYADGGACCGGMIVGPDGTIYFSNGYVHAVSPDGRPKWVYSPTEPGGIISAPALSADGLTVYVSSASNIHALDTAGGWVTWSRPIENLADAAPVIGRDGFVYISNGSSVAVFNPYGMPLPSIPVTPGTQVTSLALDSGPMGETLIATVYAYTIDPVYSAITWATTGELLAIDPKADPAYAIHWSRFLDGAGAVLPESKPIVDSRGVIYIAVNALNPSRVETGVHFYAFTPNGDILFDSFTPTTWMSDLRVLSMDNLGTIYLLSDGFVKAYFTPDTTPPVLYGIYDQTYEAMYPSGTDVYFYVGAWDDQDPNPSVSCDAVSGSRFPVGTATVTCTATDASGNPASGSFRINIVDTTPPAITPPPAKTAEATGPLTPVSIGVATATDLVGPVTVSSNAPAAFPLGTTIVTWTARDGAGNSISGNQAVTVSDTIAPVTGIVLSGTSGANGWFISAVTAAITGSDSGSGVVRTEYSFDGSSWLPYTAAVIISTEGRTKIYARSFDQAGNPSAVAFAEASIDKTPPSSSAAVAGPLGTNGIYTGSAVVTLSATDSGSGVAAVLYSLDGGTAWQTYVGPLTVATEGSTAVLFRAMDNAGINETTVKSVAFTIDTVAPVVIATDPANGDTVPIPPAITVTFSEPVTAGIAFNAISLKKGKHEIAVTTTLNSSVLTITPTDALAKGSTYTVDIPAAAVNDAAGHPLATETSFSFSTNRR